MIYVTWDRFDGSACSCNGVLVSHSTDGGKTFSAPVFASSTAPGRRGDIGADPFVSPSGTLHVAWHDVQNNEIVEESSANGGQSFGPTHTISPTEVAFDIAIPVMATRRALVYPACGADTSTGPDRGNLCCSWMDQAPGQRHGHLHVPFGRRRPHLERATAR